MGPGNHQCTIAAITTTITTNSAIVDQTYHPIVSYSSIVQSRIKCPACACSSPSRPELRLVPYSSSVFAHNT
jgi:hypothetical protein